MGRQLIPLNKKNILFENPNWHNLPSGYTELLYVESNKLASKVFDGTESFVKAGILDNCWSCTTRVDSDTTFTNRTTLCTHYNSSSTLPASTYRQGYALAGKVNDGTRPAGKYIGFGAVDNYTTESDFKEEFANQYTAGHPVTIIYSVATALATANKFYYMAGGIPYHAHTFVPAKNQNNVAGLYCIETSTFITDVAEESFTAGPVVPKYLICPVNKSAVLSKRLPDGYTELEYIESQGDLTYSVPINIESYNTDKVIVDANIDITIGSGDRYITSASNSWIDIASGGTTWYIRFGSQASVSTSIQTEDIGQRNIYELYKGHFDINGTTKLSPSYVSMSGYWNIFGPSIGRAIPCKMYSYKIVNTDTGVLRFNGVPAKNSSNVVGMYDLVTNQFFTNAGTGDFIAGPEAHTLYPISQEILYLENN